LAASTSNADIGSDSSGSRKLQPFATRTFSLPIEPECI
jgi:hypothetical protein